MALDTRLLALVVSIAGDIKRLFSDKQEALGFTPYDSTNPSNYITDTLALKAIEDAKVSVFSAVISKFSSPPASVTIGQPIGGTTAVWKSGQLILVVTTGDLYKVQTDGTVVLFRILPSESTMLVSVLYGVNTNLGPITLLYTKVAGDVISTLFNPVHAGNVYYRDSGGDSNVDTKLAMIGNSANLQTSIKYSLVGAINELFDNKQNKLVSGDSLKTVGGQDLLGSGNIELTSDNITNSLGYTPINILEIGAPNGITPLGADSKIPALYLPSYVDDVLEVATYTALPVIGEKGKIYIAIDDNAQYRWSGSVYIELVSSPGSTDEVPEGSVNQYFTASKVLNSVLTGLSLVTGAAVTATDSILSAIGKIQKQLNFQEVWNNGISDALLGISNLANGKVDASAKDASDGFPGLTGFKLNLRNTANTVTSWFTTTSTTARTWTMPDKSGTVALLTDVTSGGITVSETPPISPVSGQEWEDTTSSIRYTWIINGSASAWVELSPSVTTGAIGPAGSVGLLVETDKKILFNDSGILTGSDHVKIDNGDLILSSVKTPITPSPGFVKVYGKTLASRVMFAAVGPSAMDYTLQPSIWRQKIGIWSPPGAAVTLPGVFGLTAPTLIGTVTLRAIATTNLLTRTRRLGYNSAATAGALAGQYTTLAHFTSGDGSGLGGVFYSCRFAFTDATVISTARAFVGLSSAITIATNVEPSTLTNSIGLAQISTDNTQLYIVYGGGLAQTPIPLGVDFPPMAGVGSVNGIVYDLTLFSSPNSFIEWSYRVERVGTTFVAEGTIKADVINGKSPGNGILLAHRAWRCNNTIAAATSIDIISIYVETDF